MSTDIAPLGGHTEAAALEPPPVSARSFIAWTAATFAVLGALNVGLSFHFGPLQGDLARVGGFAERDYAPRLPQPERRLSPNVAPLAEADLVVLGDSFSNRLYWQGDYEALTGQKTLTYQYGQAGCVSNWLQWLHAQPLKPGARVVVESVERAFVPRFAALVPCPALVPEPVRRHLAAPEGGLFEGIGLDIGNQARTLLHTATLGDTDNYSTGQVMNAALVNHDRFSSRRADRILYYSDDESLKPDAASPQVARALANLRREQAAFAAAGIRFELLLVPDKSSIYRADMRRPRFGESGLAHAVQEAGLAPVDMQACFRGLATQTSDFYLPDDTHLGTLGFEYLARSLATGRCPELAR